MNPRKKKPTAIKRKKHFIKPGFQARFIVKFCLILLLGGGITIGLTLFTTQGTLTSSFINSKLVIQNTSLAIMPSVIYTTLITTVLIGLVVILVTLLVSHKIAGPIFRFEKDIERITRGDLKSRINIRKGDQFQEMATSLNTMIESLNNRVVDIRDTVHVLAGKKELPKTCSEEIAQLDEKINRHFKL